MKKPTYRRNKEYVAKFKEAELTGDEEARAKALEELLIANAGLIASIAKRYVGRVDILPFESLYNEGVFGLVRAAEKFDFSKRVEFSTYATWWIRKKIQEALRDNTPIRLPRGPWETAMKAYKVRAELQQALGREPTIAEIANRINVPAELLERFLHVLEPVSSLQSLLYDDSGEKELLERVADPNAIKLFEEVESQDRLKLIRN